MRWMRGYTHTNLANKELRMANDKNKCWQLRKQNAMLFVRACVCVQTAKSDDNTATEYTPLS